MSNEPNNVIGEENTRQYTLHDIYQKMSSLTVDFSTPVRPRVEQLHSRL